MHQSGRPFRTHKNSPLVRRRVPGWMPFEATRLSKSASEKFSLIFVVIVGGEKVYTLAAFLQILLRERIYRASRQCLTISS